MELVVRDVRPWGRALTTLAAKDGILVEPSELPTDATVLDGAGAIALPGLTNAHVHPDKTTWRGPWLSRPQMSGIGDFIDFDIASRDRLARSPTERASVLLADSVAFGTRAMRAHVDVAPVYGIDNVTAVRAAADRFASALHVQIVAFPQAGLRCLPGTRELLEQAVACGGADLVGGLDPWSFDGDGDGQLDDLTEIAHGHRVDIDLHLHDGGADGVERIDAIARRALSEGLTGRVTISHGFGLGDVPFDQLSGTIDLLLEADVAVATCAHGDVNPLPHRELIAAGVRVGLGTDGIRDAWSPLGSPDMIERVHLLAYRIGLDTDDELVDAIDFVARGADRLIGLPPVNFEPGDPADFFLVEAENVAQVAIDRPARTAVVSAGEVVSR